MSIELFSADTLSVIDDVRRCSTAEAVFAVFNRLLGEIGAEYFGVTFLARPGERIEDVCIGWQIREDWRELYSNENFCQIDPAVRYCRRSILPFDWASAPYDPETEPHMKMVMHRARDYRIDKGISVPIPSPTGLIGVVWVAGPHFNDRRAYRPVLHSLSFHVFHRLEQIVGNRLQQQSKLTSRELEILAWASEGKTAWEIGCILSISQRTVEWHVRQACKKLGATNRLQAIAMLGDVRGTLDAAVENGTAPTQER